MQEAMEANGQSYLVLEQGSVHRQQPNSRDSSIVAFERYAIDLSALNQDEGQVVYKPRERTTTQLLFLDQQEGYYKMQEGRFRAELHDRLSGWLHPLAMMMIAFAALGEARTTRQGRGAAMAAAVVAVGVLRIASFAASSAAVRSPSGLIWVYGAPLAAIGAALLFALHGPRVRAWGAQAVQWLSVSVAPRLPALRRA